MAKVYSQSKRFQGISYSEKEGPRSSYFWGQSIDYRTDPSKLTLLPSALKSSGTVIVDLPVCGERYSTDLYLYGNGGNFYKKTSADVWSLEHTAGDSHGNGLKYFGEDNYLYYTTDTTIGRYGRMDADEPVWADDFIGSQGGVPTNTHVIDLESGSSQYGYCADSASLSITGDITLEAYIKPESLPSSPNSMTLVSKWNGSGDIRSYKFDIVGTSNFFGDGSDGAKTISSNTTDSPIDSACSGTINTKSLSATNASFAAGQKILIHQTRGTGAGTYQLTTIQGYTAGTITTEDKLNYSYSSTSPRKAQVMVMKQYTNVTVNSAKTWTAKAWNGTVGGLFGFYASGTVTVTGTISADAKGFAGGLTGYLSVAYLPHSGASGESHDGPSVAGQLAPSDEGGVKSPVSPPHGGAGGGGRGARGTDQSSGGGGASYGGNGVNGKNVTSKSPYCEGGVKGTTYGATDLSKLHLGSGGGGGGKGKDTDLSEVYGGAGGGAILLFGSTVTITGAVTCDGGDGADGPYGDRGGAGGGSGGSILIKAQTATLGTTKVGATGGDKGASRDGNYLDMEGGDGGVGRIHLDYYTSYSGTTSPTMTISQDQNLATDDGVALRLTVSTDGENSETLTKDITSHIETGVWARWAVAWDASAALATFYKNGVSLGTVVGSFTSIENNASQFFVGCNKNDAGNAANFFDGKMDDVRVWNDIRSGFELLLYSDVEVSTGSPNLQAYYKFNNAATDGTANANNLTLSGSPTYDDDDVPFPSPTTRSDLDQSLDTAGNTYALATAIDEGATHRQTFVPAKDPQKSIQVLVADTGDNGDWTLTVHDALNREVASKTIAHADMTTGDVEFIFDTPWRAIIGASYHFHLTASSTTGAPAVTTTTASDLETVDFHTYYQTLVESDYHPIETITNKLAIGNERYVATYDAITYNPHAITLPSGYVVRCLGRWREYLAIGCMKGTSITDYDKGVIFFWDGYSTTYNFYVDVNEGGINCILSGDPIYFVAGYSGDLMKYSGGSPVKILRLPKMTNRTTMEVCPGGITMWRALVHLGIAYDSDSSTLKKGVYAYGTLNSLLEPTLSFDYPTSLGVTEGTDLNIGLVYPMGSNLYVGWQNGVAYGVDVIDPDNDPYTYGTYEAMAVDLDKMWSEKGSNFIRSYFKPLADGDSVLLKYKLDRDDNWTQGTAVTAEDAKEARLEIPTGKTRFNEFWYAVDIETTNSDSPELYSVAVEMDDFKEEERT